MKIPFEPWIRHQSPSVEALACYEEAFLCYRIGAYRAAMLFSYLGFMTFLRERILRSPAPAGVPLGQWTNIQNRASSDDAWDSTVFDTTQQRNPAPIFVLTDEIRQQMMYWKNRRNDCAHSKDNIIEVSHVDGMWAFTKSNLNKFVVNGSRAAMRSKIVGHYDPSLTPPGAPADALVNEITQAVAAAELLDFLNDVNQDFETNRSPDEHAANSVNRNQVSFLNRCIAIGEAGLADAVKTHISQDRRLLLHFLRSFPHQTPILQDQPQQVRRCWNEDLFPQQGDDLPVLSSFLRNGLIPEAERGECLETLIRRGIPTAPNIVDEVTLADAGFFQTLERVASTEGQLRQFAWANTSAPIIVRHVERAPISEEMARSIYHAFDTVHNARELRPRLNTLFAGNETKRNEFWTIEAAHADIGRPQYLPALN